MENIWKFGKKIGNFRKIWKFEKNANLKKKSSPTADDFGMNFSPIRGGIPKGKVANLRSRFDKIEEGNVLEVKRLKKSCLKPISPGNKHKKRLRTKTARNHEIDKNELDITRILDYYRSQGQQGGRGGTDFVRDDMGENTQ